MRFSLCDEPHLAVALNCTGARLPEPLLSQLEDLFEADLAGISVQESSLACLLEARAFACGHSIFFAPGEMNWSTPSGLHLLGHEIAHVLQQRRRINHQGGLAILRDLEFEAEAECWGTEVAALIKPLVLSPDRLIYATGTGLGNVIQCASVYGALAWATSGTYGWLKSWFVTPQNPTASSDTLISTKASEIENNVQTQTSSLPITPARKFEVPPTDTVAAATHYQMKADQALSSSKSDLPTTPTVPDITTTNSPKSTAQVGPGEEYIAKLGTAKRTLETLNANLSDPYADAIFAAIGVEILKPAPDLKILDAKLRELTKRLTDDEQIQSIIQREEITEKLKPKRLSDVQSLLNPAGSDPFPKSKATWAGILAEYIAKDRDKSKILKTLIINLGKQFPGELALKKKTFTPVAGFTSVFSGTAMRSSLYARLDRTAILALRNGQHLTTAQLNAYEEAMKKGVIPGGGTGDSGIKFEGTDTWVVKIRFPDAQRLQMDNTLSPLATVTRDPENDVLYLNFNQLAFRH